jgi:hypothetical protein
MKGGGDLRCTLLEGVKRVERREAREVEVDGETDQEQRTTNEKAMPQAIAPRLEGSSMSSSRVRGQHQHRANTDAYIISICEKICAAI